MTEISSTENDSVEPESGFQPIGKSNSKRKRKRQAKQDEEALISMAAQKMVKKNNNRPMSPIFKVIHPDIEVIEEKAPAFLSLFKDDSVEKSSGHVNENNEYQPSNEIQNNNEDQNEYVLIDDHVEQPPQV